MRQLHKQFIQRAGWVCFIGCILFTFGYGQESDTESQNMIQPRKLIDAHTAGMLPRGYFDFETRIYPSGSRSLYGSGVSLAVAVGITHRLNIGISYGGDGIIGRGKMKGNPYPGALIKYRIIEESFGLPGIAIGYDHQGYGGIEETSYTGFVYKSQGFFCAISKNFSLLSVLQFGIHTAVSFSLEDINTVKWPNGYVGLDIGINEELALLIEYDLALNQKDPRSETYTHPLRGFLNCGIRWAFSSSLYIEFAAQDIFEQKQRDETSQSPLGWSRELKIVYITHF